jgi:hypothetical protein
VDKYWRATKAADDNMVLAHGMLGTEGKNTDTHSSYVIIIVLSLLQWLRERASILFYTYEIVCLVLLVFHLNMLPVLRL